MSTSTPDAVEDLDAVKDIQVTSRSSGLYDPHPSAALHKLSSETGPEFSSHEGIVSQKKVPFTNGAIFLEQGGTSTSMPGDDPGSLNKPEQNQTMPASDQGKRVGLTRGRSQSGSSRRSGSRSSFQAPSNQHYHQSSPPTQESIHNSAGASLGFQGPTPQYQPSTSSPYEQRANYGGQYTIPPPSPMGLVHTPSQFSYNPTFHIGSLRSPQDPNMLLPNAHAGFQQMVQPHSHVYPYQRHSPEIMSSPHLFPGGYPHSQVTPSPPPMSPMSAQSSGGTFGSAGQFHSLQFPGNLSPAQYPAYASQASFPSSASMYQSQYAPSPYSHHFAPPPAPDQEGTWWYLLHGAPPPSHPFENVQPPYQAHYPMGYSHLGRREVEPPYTPTGSGPTAPTPPTMYPPIPARSAAQKSSRSDRPLSSSSSSAAHEPTPHTPTSQAESISPTAASKPAVEHIITRRSYHPNPPAHRSEWVMWAGNVPSDAVHDELWRFFKQPPSRNSTRSASPEHGFYDNSDKPLYDGVSSIFLISRSNCAFVNFDSEAHLDCAIQRFNGQPLRPNDHRCPRLVCRVRRKDDDLKAGVGAQRGMGIHARWIKEKGATVTGGDTTTPSTSEAPSSPSAEQLGPLMAAMSISSDEDRSTTRAKQSSSGSYASTNSSFLARYFPKRYFILKSLTQLDLDISIEKGLWATQKHNEGILDKAYRTSSEVYLVFGVNKSGEFYGFAKMAGPVLHGEHQVLWASRAPDSAPSSRSSHLATAGSSSRHPEEAVTPGHLPRRMDPPTFFSPVENRLVEESPLPLNTSDMKQTVMDSKAESDRRDLQSAPAELGPARRKFTRDSPRAKQSLGTDLVFNHPVAAKLMSSGSQKPPDGFKLDPEAPIRARRSSDEEEQPGVSPTSLRVVAEEDEKSRGAGDDIDDAPRLDVTPREGWGESFKVEWLCTDRLPFYRIRHFRNPWNNEREIKVSRDGTELEPSVGQKLLEDWASLAAESATDVDRGTVGASRRLSGATESAPVSAQSVPLARDSTGGKGEGSRS